MSALRYLHVIFDLDGTLMDTADGILHSVRYTLEKNQLPVAEDSVLRYFIGPSLHDSFTHFFPGREEKFYRKLIDDYREEYDRSAIPMSPPFSGVPELLYALKEKGAHLWVASTKNNLVLGTILQYHGLLPLFDGYLGAFLDGRRSAKEELLNELLKGIADDKTQCVMIGDRFLDMEGAKKVGLDGIGVLWSGTDRQEFSDENVVFMAENVARLQAFLLPENQKD